MKGFYNLCIEYIIKNDISRNGLTQDNIKFLKDTQNYMESPINFIKENYSIYPFEYFYNIYSNHLDNIIIPDLCDNDIDITYNNHFKINKLKTLYNVTILYNKKSIQYFLQDKLANNFNKIINNITITETENAIFLIKIAIFCDLNDIATKILSKSIFFGNNLFDLIIYTFNENKFEMFKILFDIYTNKQFIKNSNAIRWIIENNNIEWLSFLLNNNFKRYNNVLITAIEKNFNEAIPILLDHGFDPLEGSPNAFQIAASKNNGNVIQMFNNFGYFL